jgi:peptidylprolyl isomerase
VRISVVFLLVFLASSLTGCLNQSGSKSASHKPSKEPEVEIEEIEEGTGRTPKEGQTCIINYVGKLRSGRVFDSSIERGKPFEFELGKGEVIRGWEDAVSVMAVGGKYRVTIPPQLAYGKDGHGAAVPPNATLIFEMELVGLKGGDSKNADRPSKKSPRKRGTSD